MTDGLTLRTVERSEWPDAMTLAARAFTDEPWVAAFFGDEPVRRFELAHRMFRATAWRDEDFHVGAFVGDVIVGLCLLSRQGACRICFDVDAGTRPEGPQRALDWQFEVNVQQAHADQGPHAWLSKLVVDPTLRGAGLGRALVQEVLGRADRDGAATVLLECQAHRERLYLASGFRRVRSFPDPAGPPALLMRIDVGAAAGGTASMDAGTG